LAGEVVRRQSVTPVVASQTNAVATDEALLAADGQAMEKEKNDEEVF